MSDKRATGSSVKILVGELQAAECFRMLVGLAFFGSIMICVNVGIVPVVMVEVESIKELES